MNYYSINRKRSSLRWPVFLYDHYDQCLLSPHNRYRGPTDQTPYGYMCPYVCRETERVSFWLVYMGESAEVKQRKGSKRNHDFCTTSEVNERKKKKRDEGVRVQWRYITSPTWSETTSLLFGRNTEPVISNTDRVRSTGSPSGPRDE